MSYAKEVLKFQQEHSEKESIQYAMQQVAFEDVLSSSASGMYSSIWTFADSSQLYLEEETFYEQR